MSPGTRREPKLRRKPQRKAPRVNWEAIVVLGSVAIQVGGKVLQVWIEGRGGFDDGQRRPTLLTAGVPVFA
jgi:hypothetical protein